MATDTKRTVDASLVAKVVLMLATDVVVGDAHHREAIRAAALDLADALGDDGLAAKLRILGTLPDAEAQRLAALSAALAQPAVTAPYKAA